MCVRVKHVESFSYSKGVFFLVDSSPPFSSLSLYLLYPPLSLSPFSVSLSSWYRVRTRSKCVKGCYTLGNDCARFRGATIENSRCLVLSVRHLFSLRVQRYCFSILFCLCVFRQGLGLALPVAFQKIIFWPRLWHTFFLTEGNSRSTSHALMRGEEGSPCNRDMHEIRDVVRTPGTPNTHAAAST